MKKITDVAEGVKHTIEHPVEAAKETVAQAVRKMYKSFLGGPNCFFGLPQLRLFYFLLIFNCYQSSCN